MLALHQGDSYLFEPEHQYAVFVYALDRAIAKDISLLHPTEQRRFSRLYPSLIGAMGHPGWGLLIAQRLRGGMVTFIFGYIGWDGFPVLAITLRCTSLWDGLQPMGLDQRNINWLQQQIDFRTLITANLLHRDRLNYAQAEQSRREALAQRARLLVQYKEEERRKRANTPAAKLRRERARIWRQKKAHEQKLERERQQAERTAAFKQQATLNNLAIIAECFMQAAIKERFQAFAQTAITEGYKGDLTEELGLPAEPTPKELQAAD